ncbi:hypothetical protein QYE76_060797 [Lolium multiflorum]|uniref:Uncharacterized protein n=1 Tax=Lolium multiflorum TaxID=4521 RepID=A0AAD8W6X6_LOLMU|nr:hypothetical protein QYE76_060776 [Lolium multiflorum]KAK1642992.1 hypothetical protein QYE76_060797 [Lolium multiflorum]
MDGGWTAAVRRLLRWKQRQGLDGGGAMRRLLRWKQRQGPGRGRPCAGYVGSSDRGLTGRRDAPAATLEQRQGPDGAAADAPTMGISFFSIAGGFLRGFSSVVEKMMGQERRLQ